VFPVRYELNSYILFGRNPLFKGLIGSVGSSAGAHAVVKRKIFTAPRSEPQIGQLAA
jgi:hypothetical protein